MFNKKITIGLITIFFVVGIATGFIIGKNTNSSNNTVAEDAKKNSTNTVVEDSKKDSKDGSEFVGKWAEKDYERSGEKVIISQPSPSTFTIEKEYAEKSLVGEYKEGILIGEFSGKKCVYTLKDGILTEKRYDNKTFEYKKVDEFEYNK